MLHHQPEDGALPRIIVSKIEELRLSKLATAAELTGRAASAAKALLAEMDRALLVEDSEVPADVVRLYSDVEFELDGRRRRARLVYPHEADISLGNISILTPIGAALIGLAPSQTIAVDGADGKPREIRVLSVSRLADMAG